MTRGQQQPRIAIVAEGGGQRGIFTAGILDAFQKQDFNPFDFALGVSAGAQNLLSYWLGERGYARRLIEEVTTRPDFFVPYRWLIARSVVDLDNYFKHAEANPKYRLPLESFDPLVEQKPLFFVATDKATSEAVYLQPGATNVMDCMRASSTVPFLYRKAVSIDGRELFDGGVADPIPVIKAYELGATHIVVIRTLPGKITGSTWRERFHSALKNQTLHPQLATMLRKHEEAYRAAIQFMREPPGDVQVLTLAPPAPLHSQTFGSSSNELVYDYYLGMGVGHEAMEKIESWIKD